MKKINTPTLKTARLTLKPTTPEDAPALEKHFNNWNIIKNLNDTVPWPYPDGGTLTFLQEDVFPRIERNEAHMWTITLDGKSPIGLIEYRAIPAKTGGENRGFWIGEPYWKMGYMSEAITAVNDFIFFELKADKIVITNFADNIGSKRVKEKTGATYLKSITEDWRGEKRTSEYWELTAESWKLFKTNQ